MWRAWGIALLLVSPQDLGSRVNAPDHEFSICPPAGWTRHLGAGPTLVKYTQPGDLRIPGEFLVTHLHSSNPTPIESWKTQARENVKEKYAGAKILEEKDLSIAGKPAYRLAFSHEEKVYVKTVVHRTNLEYYLLDGVCSIDAADKLRPLLASAVATFEIVPLALSSDERAADTRTMSILKGSKVDAGLLGERWYSIHIGPRKVGHMRFKMSEAAGAYEFETDVNTDFGEGNTDVSTVRGSFSPDGRVQKVETNETKVNPKQKWTFHASAAVQAGQVKISRNINGVKEDRAFQVEDGVLLSDVAEILRSALVGAGKGTYLLKTLSAYSELWNVEMIDVGGPERLDFDGKSRECILVQAYIGRRKNATYFYAPNRTVLRVGGPKELLAIRATTKEDAQK